VRTAARPACSEGAAKPQTGHQSVCLLLGEEVPVGKLNLGESLRVGRDIGNFRADRHVFDDFIFELRPCDVGGEVSIGEGAPGEPIPLPDLVTSVRRGDREWRVEGGGNFRPAEVGAYYLLAGQDTLGAIAANLDPRETLLRPASDAQVRRLWKDARVVALGEAAPLAFSAGALGDLRGPLLWLALGLGLGEMALAAGWRRVR